MLHVGPAASGGQSHRPSSRLQLPFASQPVAQRLIPAGDGDRSREETSSSWSAAVAGAAVAVVAVAAATVVAEMASRARWLRLRLCCRRLWQSTNPC